MKLLDLLLDSMLYTEICNYLEIVDIKNIFISNKKIYENNNNKKYTKSVILEKIRNKMDFSFYLKEFTYSNDNELEESINKMNIIHKNLLNYHNAQKLII